MVCFMVRKPKSAKGGREMKRCWVVIILGCVLLFVGCKSFQIKNTEGLGLAYEDVDRASSKAVQLKSLENVSEEQRQEAVELYRDIKAVINGYLKKAITDASSYTVDQNVESYKSTGATEKVLAFQEKVNELRSPINMTSVDWVPIAIEAIEMIVKLHDQDQKAAYERFVDTVERYKMKNYEELPGQ